MRCQERESKGAGRSWLPPREAGSLVGGGNETRRHGWEEGGPRGRGRDEGLAEGAGLSHRTVQRGGLGRTARRFAAPALFSPFVLSLDWRKRERTAHPVVITGQSGGFVKLAFHLGKKKGGATPRRSTSELVQSSGLEIRGAASSGSGSVRPPRAHLRPCCSRWAEASPCFSFSGTVTHPLTHKHPPKRHTHIHQTAGGAHSQK